MSSDRQTDGGRLRRVGALWKPKAGSKSLGSGALTIGTKRQRFIVVKNDRKAEGSREPDYLLLSSDEPETDEYARDRAQGERAASRPAARDPEPFEATVDDIPF